MSRFGNKLRSGFYATPEKQGAHIKRLLEFEEGGSAVLDPTCGEGEILKQLTKGIEGVVSYGVELDKARAAKAQSNIDVCVQAPIESMVIQNNVFSMLYLNPPYDFAIKSYDEDEASRKEFDELKRNIRYLAPGGILIYCIPSYRFSDKRIARFLSVYFDKPAIMRFTDEDDDFEQFRQAVFIGRKKSEVNKDFNEKVYEFLLRMESDDFTREKVTPINKVFGHRTWVVPKGITSINPFYSRLEKKNEYYEGIIHSKGFQAFKERTKPKELELGGTPILPINEGQLALLLAAGAINGELGEGDTYHLVQGLEDVSIRKEEEPAYDSNGNHYGTKVVERTIRQVSVKLITENRVKKLM